MAVTFTLSDGTTTIDFAEGTLDDFALRSNLGIGYMPKVAIPRGDGSIPDYITETIPIWIEATSHNDFATSMQNFHALQRRAAEYWTDPHQATPVWFNAKMDDETGARRALVKSLGIEFESDFGGLYNDCPDANTGRPATVVVVRHPYWERSAALSAVTTTNVSPWAGTFDYSATDVVGDVPARVYALKIVFDDSDFVHRAYIGFRSASKHGTLANFVPLWEVEDGTEQTDASVNVDATASDGNSVEVDFATQTSWYRRETITLSNISANESDNYGVFLMLLAAKVDAATTADVRVDRGFPQISEYDQDGDPVAVSSTSWAWHNMGLLQIPSRDIQSATTTILSDSSDQSFRIEIFARRTSGAGSLHMDCIAMIPVDEFFIYCDAIYGITTDTRTLLVTYSPHDRPHAMTYTDGLAGDNISSLGIISTAGGGVPVGDGRMYVVLENQYQTRPVSTDTYDPSIQIIPRWITLRGSE